MSAAERIRMSDDDSGTLVPFRGNADLRALREDQRAEERKWLDTDELAVISGISVQNVRKAIRSRSWRGCDLVIRHVTSSRGQTGRIPQVHVDSLPGDLRDAWYLSQGIDLHGASSAGVARMAGDRDVADDPAWQEALALAQWKLRAIRAAVDLPARSPERGEAVAAITATPLEWPNGKVKAVTKQTVGNWIRAYETGGLQGLIRKKRKDVKAARVTVTRCWDGFFDAADPVERQAVADTVERYIRSLWAGGENGWRAIAEKASTRLIEMSVPLGCGFSGLPRGRLGDTTARKTQFGVCAISRRRVEASRSYAKVAIRDRDNARWEDAHAPRISRDYSALAPRDMIVGDVHPVDIMMRRPDGSQVYPKAIAWFDPATAEIWMTFVMLEKGEGVRREHVAQSFASMVEGWGLPKLLYLDNGSEYRWSEMIGGFTMLSRLAGTMSVFDLQADSRITDLVTTRRENVLRSRAYNAPGKPGIEGRFGNIEQVQFSNLVGWTAGDRMNKRTHQKGRDPVPFPGTMEEFLAQADTALEWYHKRPQSGHLKGRSPNECLRDHIADGWGKTALARPEVMMLAFAYEATRVPDRGRISYKSPRGASVTYYHDALLPFTGETLTVKSPAGRDDVLFVFRDDALLCMAKPEVTWHPLDPGGATEANRRRKVLNRIISERRKHCDRLSLVEETARHVSHLEDTPDSPVALTVDHAQIAEMQRRLAAADAATPDSPKPERPVDQWGVSDPTNVTFLEDEENDD